MYTWDFVIVIQVKYTCNFNHMLPHKYICTCTCMCSSHNYLASGQCHCTMYIWLKLLVILQENVKHTVHIRTCNNHVNWCETKILHNNYVNSRNINTCDLPMWMWSLYGEQQPFKKPFTYNYYYYDAYTTNV